MHGPYGRKPGGIALVGFMASGKSSVGRRLAALSGLDFVDLDAEIERVSGMTVTEIFKSRGEDGFRTLESMALSAVSERDGLVLSLGGGAVLGTGNRDLMARRFLVVWLDVTAGTALRRARSDGPTRPLLSGDDPEKTISRLLAARLPLYRSCADLRVDSESGGPDEIAEAIHEHYRKSI